MDNYNLQLQNNNSDLQMVLQTLQNKAVGGGEQATPEITVDSNGLITAIAGTKSATHQLAFQPAKTITPSTTNQIAVSSGYYTGGNITVAGDSNLVASNIKDGVSIFGISGTLKNNNNNVENEIIYGTISTYTNDNVDLIRPQAFAYCSYLTSVSFRNCTNIGGEAFYSCHKLSSVFFPSCELIQSGAFSYCLGLTEASFPKCTVIKNQAFNLCYNLSKVSFPICIEIGESAFALCNGALASISFPVCSIISEYAFQGCRVLATAYFGECKDIRYQAFSSCWRLSSFTLATSSVCTLSNSVTFTSTPFAGYKSYFSGTPHIYVPASLVNAYKSATNWVYFSSYITAIEDMEV